MEKGGEVQTGDTIRVGAKWEITDVIFEPLDVSWDDWETSFADTAVAQEPDEPWFIEDSSFEQDEIFAADWTIDDSPLYEYPGEEQEAMAYITKPDIEPVQSGSYPTGGSSIGRAWINLRRVFQPEYGLVPVTHRPDPEFAQKMIMLREENNRAPQKTTFYDQDLDDRIFPAAEDAEQVSVVQVDVIAPHETVPEVNEPKSWLSRTGEWISHRRRSLGIGAIALSSTALLFADTTQDITSTKASNPRTGLSAELPPAGDLPAHNSETAESAVDNAGDETEVAAEANDDEVLSITIPEGGNLSWSIEYELAMRGVEEDQLESRVSAIVSHLQAQYPDRDLGLVFPNEVIKVAMDEQIKHLFAAA